MRDVYSNLGFYHHIASILSDETNGTTLNGLDIDLQGYDGVAFCVVTGSVESGTTSTVSYFHFRIQHTSASSGGLGPSDYADVVYAKHLIHSVISKGASNLTSGIWQDHVAGTTDGSKTYPIGYIGPKRYVRIVIAGSGNSSMSINVACLAMRGLPGNWPINTPA